MMPYGPTAICSSHSPGPFAVSCSSLISSSQSFVSAVILPASLSAPYVRPAGGPHHTNEAEKGEAATTGRPGLRRKLILNGGAGNDNNGTARHFFFSGRHQPVLWPQPREKKPHGRASERAHTHQTETKPGAWTGFGLLFHL